MKTGEPKEPVDLAERTLRDLDRKAFYLKNICNATRELNGSEDTAQIIETFLLTAMGTLGIAQGFIFVINMESVTSNVATRGLGTEVITKLQEKLPEIVQHYFPFPSPEETPLPIEAQIIERKDSEDLPFYPDQIKLLILWAIDKDCFGLLGLGEKIFATPYDEEDTQFLFGLINSLIGSLYHAKSMASLRQLNSALSEQNAGLERALKQAEISGRGLTKQVFQLNILYDTVHELSGMVDSEKILETFLLMTMGAFSVEQGYILLFDRKEKTGHMACRGFEKEKLKFLSQQDIEKAVTIFVEVARNKLPGPKNALLVTDRKLLDTAGYPMEAEIGILFTMNDACLGFLGLGKKITEEDYSQEEQELLMKLVNNLIVCLDNARSFEAIKKLNLNLEKRYLELTKAREQLEASRLTIEVLERAKANIKSIIQKEMGRARRVAAIDFLLIFGVALVVGIIFNLSNPSGISPIPSTWSTIPLPRIDIPSAKMKYDAGTALFVDARPLNFFKQRHVKGAINLSLALFDFVYIMNFEQIDPQREVIVYGRNFSRLYDDEVAFKLQARGHTNVRVLSGGLSAWEKEYYPVEP
jgi:rhodanese-related sulfurtransferase